MRWMLIKIAYNPVQYVAFTFREILQARLESSKLHFWKSGVWKIRASTKNMKELKELKLQSPEGNSKSKPS